MRPATRPELRARLERHGGLLGLLLLAAAIFLLLAWAGALCTTARPDTPSYEVALKGSLPTALSWHRALGYPTFLQAVEAATGDLRHLPHIQLALFFVAVLVLSRGLRLYYGSELVAYLACLPLLVSPLVWRFATAVLSDVPAASLALLAVAALFWALARPRLWLAWVALALAIFLTYQVRPAYLFLLGAMPLAGLALHLRREGNLLRPQAWWPALRRPGLAFALVVLLPFLGWSSLRAVLAGHFGVVSFGGMNIVGIAGSMLTPEAVPRLPADLQQLGKRMLAARRERRLDISPDYDFLRWSQQFNPNVWQVAVPTTGTLLENHGFPPEGVMVEANRRLTRLSWALIRQRPLDYLRWIRDGLGRSLGLLAREPQIWASGAFALVALALALGTRSRNGRAGTPERAAPASADAPESADTGTQLVDAGIDLAILAGLYFVLAIGLVVVVEFPLDRYVLATGLLLPCPLLLLGAGWLMGGRAGRETAPASVLAVDPHPVEDPAALLDRHEAQLDARHRRRRRR